MSSNRPTRQGDNRKGCSRGTQKSDRAKGAGEGQSPEIRAKEGRDASLLNAFQKHQAALKRFISRYLRNAHDIEDVAQEAFLRAYSAGNYTEIRQPKSLLFRIARNVAVSELRLKSRQITDYIDDQDASDVLMSEGTLEDEVMAREKLGIHCEAVASLAPQCRRVYLMRKVYGMPHREIAERLDVSESTVRNHLMKGVELCDRYVREHTAEGVCAKPGLVESSGPDLCGIRDKEAGEQ